MIEENKEIDENDTYKIPVPKFDLSLQKNNLLNKSFLTKKELLLCNPQLDLRIEATHCFFVISYFFCKMQAKLFGFWENHFLQKKRTEIKLCPNKYRISPVYRASGIRVLLF